MQKYESAANFELICEYTDNSSGSMTQGRAGGENGKAF